MPKTHAPYDPEFRREAVALYLSSGKPRRQVARELGVSDGSLRKWESDLKGLHGGSGGRGRDPRERVEEPAAADPVELAREVRRLARENEYLRRQREILKKAASILAEDPQLGMR